MALILGTKSIEPLVYDRWIGEPVKAFSISTQSFSLNHKGFPVLNQPIRNVILSLYKLNCQVLFVFVLFVCLFICLFVYFVCLFVCFVCLFVYLFVCLFVCLFICLFVYFVCLFVCFVCLFVYLFVCLFVCLFVYLFVCLFVCLFICLFIIFIHTSNRVSLVEPIMSTRC